MTTSYDEGPDGYVGRRRNPNDIPAEALDHLVLAELALLIGDQGSFLAQRAAARDVLRERGLTSLAAGHLMALGHHEAMSTARDLRDDLAAWISGPVWVEPCEDQFMHAAYYRSWLADHHKGVTPDYHHPHLCGYCGRPLPIGGVR